jgi:hypothetical protein
VLINLRLDLISALFSGGAVFESGIWLQPSSKSFSNINEGKLKREGRKTLENRLPLILIS